jgi:hypothetical protein
MSFHHFIVDVARWSFHNGALSTWATLFVLMMLFSYLVSSAVSLSLVPSRRRIAIIATAVAWLSLLCVLWGNLEQYTQNREVLWNGKGMVPEERSGMPQLP